VKGETAGSPARWPRIAVTAVFVVHGLLFASWTAHIPDVKAHLGLTDGTLGFALLRALRTRQPEAHAPSLAAR
jgi:hypothetical protein